MVKTAAKWVKSSFCANGNCVEVADHGDVIAVRDSKSPERGMLRFSPDEWRDFIVGIQVGDFPR